MKRIVGLFLPVILLVILGGCVPESLTGLVKEPMDAAIFDVLDEDTQAFFANFSEAPPSV